MLTINSQGLDIPNVLEVAQWKLPESLCTLMQRLGRAARSLDLAANATLFVEDHFLYPTLLKRKQNAEKASARREQKRKRADDDEGESESPAKRCATEPVTARGKKAVDASPNFDPLRAPETYTNPDYANLVAFEGGLDKKKVEEAMYLYVNAESHLKYQCRRAVTNMYFGNDKLGKSYFILLITITNCSIHQ